ncbi:hypothetical protein [Usitatibacter palustris]|uniref:DUF4398 domain-containing protein n=1 Tax=Usitatibacter palustris TaxID=2732487 RepID=A0A6M4H4L1_9PROT|nr:hypothetical protein [Usitatibacter palustris]QJR14496.1 hypothetical protein DSM104440_01297 [Usitatibacter palustris]
MLESSKVYGVVWWGLMVAACAMPETSAPVAPPVVVAPAPAPKIDDAALEQEARAFLAQAETDIQRARAKRALWSKAWESLVLARQAAAAKDNNATRTHAKRASELAQLGMEQLAYPAVK